jgi:hypothetical protein
MRVTLTTGFFALAIALLAKDKPTIKIQVVETQTSQREFAMYYPGTPAKSTTNCDIHETTADFTTTTTPGREPSTVINSIEQAHVKAIMQDGRHVTLWCQHGVRRCKKLTPGYYNAELAGNSVWIQVYDLDGTTMHKIKYRYEGGW